MNMQNRLFVSAALIVLFAGWTGTVQAEDAAPAAPTEAAVDAVPAVADTATSIEDNLDNLEFASGEATGFDAGKLQVKVYLDDAGNPAESTIDLTVDNETEITNGEKDLDSSSLKAGVEIDVEYDKTSKKATYIFVY